MRLCEIDLDSLPVIRLGRRPELRYGNAVYFIYVGEELIYIGRTRMLPERFAMRDHQQRFEACADLVSIRWLDCSRNGDMDLRECERYFLALLSPPLNLEYTSRHSTWAVTSKRKPIWSDLQNMHISA